MKKIVASTIFAFFVGTLALSWLVWDGFANKRNSASEEEVIFEVKPGMSFGHVVHELARQQLIQNSSLFSLFAKVKGEAGKMKVGEYSIKKNMFPMEVLAVINSGKSIGRPFTVPEGMNIYEISEMYEEEGFGMANDLLALMKDKAYIKNLTGESLDSLEGYLFPETYSLTKYTDAKVLLVSMYKKFDSVWQEVAALAPASGLTKHQIITLASIIEKETGAPEERPLISSVFHNRLHKGMKLQTDPTVIYGKVELSGKPVLNISRADLLAPTKYNTYTIPALPPGPIANPSKEALVAAMKPEASEYLFFVSKNEGTHTFSKDYASHVNAVKKFQLDPKARQGKSWRDMKKSAQGKTKI